MRVVQVDLKKRKRGHFPGPGLIAIARMMIGLFRAPVIRIRGKFRLSDV